VSAARWGAWALDVLLSLPLTACVAALPPARPEDLAGCSPGSYGALGPDDCSGDEDCVVCRDGSACGVPVSRAHADERGAACAMPQARVLAPEGPDGSVCDASGVACCQHRCVFLLGPPVFGRGTDDEADPARR
jgi:hypothetical protein